MGRLNTMANSLLIATPISICWLKARDPVSGVRDFEWVNELAESAGLKLLEDNDMPANNQMLVWIIRLAPPGRYARFLDPGWSNPDIFPQRPGEPAS